METIKKPIETDKEGIRTKRILSPAGAGSSVRRAERQKCGWISPDYVKSRKVELDPRKAEENRCVCLLPGTPEIDCFKVIRTQILQQTRKNGWNTLMITSVNPGEGKTVIAVNLAITFAKEYNQTVLLVDADLKQQKVHQYLGCSSQKGLIDYLEDDRLLSELIIWPGIEKLTFISGGKTVRDSAELLGSPRMKALIREMKGRYEDRYVFFDVPAILGRADAIAFSPLVDCIVMIVEEGKTSINDVKKAIDLIPKEKFLGFILNRNGEPVPRGLPRG